MLTLQIKEKEIENLTPEEEFVRGTVGAKCQINFDEFWQSYNKYIVFKRVGYEPINFMVDTLENEIEIPYTILAESGEFKIGVFGTTETETLPTLYSKDIKILYGTDTHGTTPPKYEPNEIDQLRLSKQDKLTAGDNITIDENNVISATGGGGSGGTTDYELLENKPQINDIELLGNKSLTDLGIDIPTKTSDLENDSGFIDDTAFENYYTKTEVDEKTVVDQTYNKNSQNAQSGKAVAEAVSIEQNRVDNTFANALKGTKSDTAMLLDDVSSVTHEMSVKISSDTVTDLTAVKVTRCGKNLFDINGFINLTGNSTYYGINDNGELYVKQSDYRDDTVIPAFVTLEAGTYTLSSTTAITSSFKLINLTDNKTIAFNNNVTFSIEKVTSLGVKCWQSANTVIGKFQLELGSTATDYEPYKECEEYTPTADGVVNGVTSLYPNTSLTTDTDGVIINCEYNRDINKAFAALEAAIATNNS